VSIVTMVAHLSYCWALVVFVVDWIMFLVRDVSAFTQKTQTI